MKIEQEVLDLIIKFSKDKYFEGLSDGYGFDDWDSVLRQQRYTKNEDILEEFTEFVFVENKQLF